MTELVDPLSIYRLRRPPCRADHLVSASRSVSCGSCRKTPPTLPRTKLASKSPPQRTKSSVVASRTDRNCTCQACRSCRSLNGRGAPNAAMLTRRLYVEERRDWRVVLVKCAIRGRRGGVTLLRWGPQSAAWQQSAVNIYVHVALYSGENRPSSWHFTTAVVVDARTWNVHNVRGTAARLVAARLRGVHQ
jgi:hypothetical protein